jgi:SagB-type dehydrogenase family enzyme
MSGDGLGGRDVNSRRGRYILNSLLLAAAVVVTVTGFLVDQLDLNEFTPHRWSGYLVAALLAVHAGLHWRWFLPARRVARQRSQSGLSAPIDSAVRAAEPANPPPMDAPVAGAPASASGPAGTTEAGSGGGGATVSAAQGGGRSHPTRRAAITAVGAGVAGVVVGWTGKSLASPDPYPGGDVGLFYHGQSALGWRGLLGDLVDWGRRPAPYLRVGDGEKVALPAVGAPPGMSVAQALAQRRSLREYADRSMAAEELAWVIRAATGITSTQGQRAAPSAGALYPVETYVAVNRVEGIDPGLYHVDVRNQALEPVRRGSVAGDLMVAGLGQDFLRHAPAVLVLTGVFQRSRWKYRARHYRYVCWEGGHVAQNIYLAAEAAGLGACMVGAFLDGMVNDLLRVDGRQEAALGLLALGPR